MYTCLQIYDGGNDSYPLLHSLTGTTHPGYVISSTNQMYLNFISDALISERGYNVSYRAVESKQRIV